MQFPNTDADMLNKNFIAQMAENTFILHWKKKSKQEYWTTLLQVKLNKKLAACFFQAHTYHFRRNNESCWEQHWPIFQNMSYEID